MKIAVLSGKGGTGKTLLSVNLSYIADKATYVDCDVEEPNGHLYYVFVEEDTEVTPIYRLFPVVDDNTCTACRVCVDFCRFNALALTGKTVTVFDQICHSCGGCARLCPVGAISEEKRQIGEVYDYIVDSVRVLSGRMQTKEAFGSPIIRTLFSKLSDADETVVIDCPPGSACAVMESIEDADVCLLVAEPTVFGAHNLNMVVDLARLFNKPVGVILNKYEKGRENPSEKYCEQNHLDVIARIPFEKELGMLHSEAQIAAKENDRYAGMFRSILEKARAIALPEDVE
ncbi:MAG: ATP-binding protein [Clostridiales bacterium]|nr:ATP-binding protein [Clostridiales bacterium]